MATKPNMNKFSRLKKKVQLLVEDIHFLKLCKKNKVTPTFIKVTCSVKNKRTEKTIEFAQKRWLNLELKYLFHKLAENELELYNLHLEITKDLNLLNNGALNNWYDFENKINEQNQEAVKKKKETLTKKFSKLVKEKEDNSLFKKPMYLPDFVCNKTDLVFTEKELALLNKGLNYTPKPERAPLVETVTDVETILKYKLPSVQQSVRNTVKEAIENVKNKKRTMGKNDEIDTLKSLKEKDCVYVKADKGNKIVILSTADYEQRMNNLIEKCQYKEVKRNPLPSMVKECNELRKDLSKIFGLRHNRTLLVSNPKVPLIYCLPKIHKTGDRPIVSSISSPCYKLAKWLVKELKQFPPIKSMSVKNSFEFVDKIKNVTFKRGQKMLSFDVESLFPSIPVDLALSEFEKYLQTVDTPVENKIIYYKVAKLCMNQNYFQFRDKIYKVEKGTNMGNPLSPLMAELVMSKLEMDLKEKGLLPDIFERYVDDIFTIMDENDINTFLGILNSQYESINFTHEIEENNQISFLDLMLKRSENNKIEIAVYHKPTSTKRCITSDSYCPIQHKQAAFHSLIYRLCKLPLSAKNYMKEYQYIKEVANVNGYNEKMVDDIIHKHSMKLKRNNTSTFFSDSALQSQTNIKRVAMCYAPEVTNNIKNKFREHDMDLVFSNNKKLKNSLGSTKDKIDDKKKSGVYTIECGDCNRLYIGLSKRSIETRFKEHSSHIKNNRPSRSAVAAHVLHNNHFSVSVNSLKLKKHITDERKLDAYESYYIQKTENTINLDNGNIESVLFSLV